MARSRLTARVSGHGRTEHKVIEANVKELSCQAVGSDSFYTDIEITKNYDREPGIKASKEDGDNLGACGGGHKKRK